MRTWKLPVRARTLTIAAALAGATLTATATSGAAVASTTPQAAENTTTNSARYFPDGKEFFPPTEGDKIGNGQVGVWFTRDLDAVEDDERGGDAFTALPSSFSVDVIAPGSSESETINFYPEPGVEADRMYLLDDPRVVPGSKITGIFVTNAPSLSYRSGYDYYHYTTPYELNGMSPSTGQPFEIPVSKDKPTTLGLQHSFYRVGYIDLKINIKGIEADDFDALQETPPGAFYYIEYGDRHVGWRTDIVDYCDKDSMSCNSSTQVDIAEGYQVAHPQLSEFKAPKGYYVSAVEYKDPQPEEPKVPGTTVGFGGKLQFRDVRSEEVTVTYGKIQSATPVAPILIPAEECGQQATARIPEVEGIEYTQVTHGNTLTVTASAAHGYVLTEGAETTWTFDVTAKQCPLEKFTLTFDPNDGSTEPMTIEVTAGESITIPEMRPTREGYVFQGWLPMAPFKIGQLIQPGDEYTPTGSTIFLAQWEEEEDTTEPPTEPTEPPTEPTEPPTEPTEPPTEPDTELPLTPPTSGNGNTAGGTGAATSGTATSGSEANNAGALAQTGASVLPAAAAILILASLGFALRFARKSRLKK